MGSHYSSAQNPEILIPQARGWAEWFIEKYKKSKRFPVIVYTGMSGIASATALSMQIYATDPNFRFGMIYVRKPNEKSHGSRIERQFDKKMDGQKNQYIFVDDFICSGASMARCLVEIYKNWHASRISKFDASKIDLIEIMRDPQSESERACTVSKINRQFNHIRDGIDEDYN